MNTPWTILIYMAADNNLYEAALANLNQITSASHRGNVEILVQFDGPTSSLASRFRCKDGRRVQLWQAPADLTASRRQRLEDFLSWSLENSRKGGKRVMLILWGHGAGIDHAYVYKDDTLYPDAATRAPHVVVRNGVQFHTKALLNADNANLYVSNIQLQDALKKFTEKLGKKIDILAFDACLMGMVEIGHEVRDSVSFMVASDEEIPQTSFPYSRIIGDLETYPGMPPEGLATSIVCRFVEGYASHKIAHGNKIPLSLAMYDLSASDAFAEKFKTLVQVIMKTLNEPTVQARIARARDFSRTPLERSYIDLAVFLRELVASFVKEREPIHDAARHALSVLTSQPYIVYHRDLAQDGAIDSRGLALYFPDSLDAVEIATGQSISDEAQAHTNKAPADALPPTPRFPIQPAFLAMKAAAMCGLAADGVPGVATKTPGNAACKTVISPDGSSRVLTSYRVLWKDYVKLEFSVTTKWPELIKEFIPHVPQKRVIERNNSATAKRSYPPNTEKDAQ